MEQFSNNNNAYPHIQTQSHTNNQQYHNNYTPYPASSNSADNHSNTHYHPQQNTHDSYHYAHTPVDNSTSTVPSEIQQQTSQIHTSPINNIHSTIQQDNNTPHNHEEIYPQNDQYTQHTNYQYTAPNGNTPYTPPPYAPNDNPSDSYNMYSNEQHTKGKYEQNQSNSSTLPPNSSTSNNKTEQFLLFALIIAISITAIVIGVGWTLFYPKPIAEKTDSVAPTTDDALSEVQNTTTNKSENQDLVIIYRADEQKVSDTSDTVAATTQNTKVKTTSRSSGSTPASTKKVVTKSTPATATPVSAVKAQPTAPAQTKKTTTTTTKKTASTETVSVPSKVHIDTKYWIQIFSTNNRDKANKIQDDLDTQGIKTIIVTKNINNSTFYRLRIGPYYNKDEGSKFLEWIRRDNKYKDAYISVEKG